MIDGQYAIGSIFIHLLSEKEFIQVQNIRKTITLTLKMDNQEIKNKIIEAIPNLSNQSRLRLIQAIAGGYSGDDPISEIEVELDELSDGLGMKDNLDILQLLAASLER